MLGIHCNLAAPSKRCSPAEAVSVSVGPQPGMDSGLHPGAPRACGACPTLARPAELHSAVKKPRMPICLPYIGQFPFPFQYTCHFIYVYVAECRTVSGRPPSRPVVGKPPVVTGPRAGGGSRHLFIWIEKHK